MALLRAAFDLVFKVGTTVGLCGFIVIAGHVAVALDEIDSSYGKFRIVIAGFDLQGFLKVDERFLIELPVELGASPIKIGFVVVLVVFDGLGELLFSLGELAVVEHELDALVVSDTGSFNVIAATTEDAEEQDEEGDGEFSCHLF